MEELELAKGRTQDFLELVRSELRAMSLDPDADSVIRLCATMAPTLTTPEEHYALREVAASAYTEGAYHFLMRKWSTGA